MNMTPVKSSNIAEIGHDPTTNTLAVRFNPRKGAAEGAKGPLWHYADVPAEKHAALLADTDSHGKHFNTNIRGQHAEMRIE